MLFSSRLIPEGRSESENRHFDLPGAVLVTARDDRPHLRDRHHGPARLGLPRRARPGRGREWLSWPPSASTRTRLTQAPAAVPLMPLSVFGLRNLRAANLVIFLLYGAIFGFWFFQSLYMQGTLGYSALETGLAFVPMTLAVGIGPRSRPASPAGSGRGWCSPPGCSRPTAGEVAPDRRPPGRQLPGERAPRWPARRASDSGSRWCPRRSSRCRASPGRSADWPQAYSTPHASSAPPSASPFSARSPPTTLDAEIDTGTSAAKALTDGFHSSSSVGAAFCLVGAIAAVVLLRPQRARRRREAASTMAEAERA